MSEPTTISNMDIKNLVGKVINDYKIEKSIGLGKFGVVYLGSKNGVLYILKIVKTSEFNKNEIEVFKKFSELCDYGKINYIEEFQLNDYNVIVSKYLTNSIDLFDYIERIHNREFIVNNNITDYIIQYNIIQIMRFLFEQLDCMHTNNIVHMDIKPENILLQVDSQYMVTYATFIDFGLSCTKDMFDESNGIVCQTSGTLEYMAPELIMQYSRVEMPSRTINFKKPLKLDDYKKTDIWSLGLTFFVLITYNLPHELIKKVYQDYHSIIAFYKNIKDSEITLKNVFTNEEYLYYKDFYDYMQYIISHMLKYEPNLRISPKILKTYLEV